MRCWTLTNLHDLSASLPVKGTERLVANLKIMSSNCLNRLIRVRAFWASVVSSSQLSVSPRASAPR
jgi:hypothetical protein